MSEDNLVQFPDSENTFTPEELQKKLEEDQELMLEKLDNHRKQGMETVADNLPKLTSGSYEDGEKDKLVTDIVEGLAKSGAALDQLVEFIRNDLIVTIKNQQLQSQSILTQGGYLQAIFNKVVEKGIATEKELHDTFSEVMKEQIDKRFKEANQASEDQGS